MEQKIILQQELKEAVYSCRTALQKAQEALKSLTRLADYPTPTTLAEVTTSNLVAFVEQRVNAVRVTPIYTQTQKDKVISEWVEWKVKAIPHVAAVERFVSDWQAVEPRLDGGVIITADLTESLTPLYTVEVPNDAYRHISLIADARKAIDNLRDFEKLMDCKKLPLQKLFQLKDDTLLQSWCDGSIKIDHRQDDEGVKAWREAVEAATL